MSAAGGLGELERLNDRLAIRVLGSAHNWWYLRRRHRFTLVPSLVANESEDRLVGTLIAAWRAGALETTAELLDRLRPRLSEPWRGSPATLASVLEALIALGANDEARVLAEVHGETLTSLASGVTVLELLGRPGPAWLPDGRPNLIGLGRRIAGGELGAEDVARLLAVGPTQWVRFPELGLLFCSALWKTHPPRALVFLNGFLRNQGSACRLRAVEAEGVGDFLGSLKASELPKRDGPLVSVIVAAHEAASTLRYAIESLLAQTHSNLELLIGDDASSDGTLDTISQYAADSRLRVFRSPSRQGAYNLRNELAAHARGQLLTFHDADDLALPTRISHQLACLRRTGAGAVVANLLRVDGSGNFIFYRDQRASRMSPVSLLLRRSTFMALGGFRSVRFGGDEELRVKLMARLGAEGVARLKVPLMLSLSHKRSSTAAPGSEAAADGYRAHARRVYSELVLRRYALGEPIGDVTFEERLAATDNSIARSALVELT